MDKLSVNSIINNHINYDAVIVRKVYGGYDRDKLKKGYKGTFLVHEHDADKAGKHWDLRLEFPVTSLKDSLGKDHPDEPGIVLRSFVSKKQEIPTAKNKVFLVKAEDHPKEYGSFEGEIEKGYGAGDVGIWDKGSFELMDAEGDKKYVIKFNGKKIKGDFAFIKYQDGFLWIKMKTRKAGIDHRNVISSYLSKG